jgi:hypothetical protein
VGTSTTVQWIASRSGDAFFGYFLSLAVCVKVVVAFAAMLLAGTG